MHKINLLCYLKPYTDVVGCYNYMVIYAIYIVENDDIFGKLYIFFSVCGIIVMCGKVRRTAADRS